jgi:hypothetical protein
MSTPETDLAQLSANTRKVIAEYIESYILEDGESTGYDPTDGERALIEDAINGLFSDSDFLKANDAERHSALLAEVAKLREENKMLTFQSRLNDTDLPDAELIAALHDELFHVTDDENQPGCGTILSKVQAALAGWTEATDENEQLTAENATLKKENKVLNAQKEMSSNFKNLHELLKHNEQLRASLAAAQDENERLSGELKEVNQLWETAYKVLCEGFNLDCLSIQAPGFAVQSYQYVTAELAAAQARVGELGQHIRQIEAAAYDAQDWSDTRLGDALDTATAALKEQV